MPSPFTGMDPWLEGGEVFPNLHERLIIYMQDALNAALPPGYVATSKNRVWVDPELQREPDVALFRRDPQRKGNGGPALALDGLTAVAQELTPDTVAESYLEIRSARGKRLVTAFEVISLTNKRAGEKGRETYRDKQHEYWLGNVNLVELDLLRRGPHVTATPLTLLREKLGAFDYHISVAMPCGRPSHWAAGIKIGDRLPAIGIPLDSGVAPITIDLQPMIDLAYDRGRYSELFSYGDPCEPPLSPEQQGWAEGVLRAKGLLP
jgi:hypothetical protein